MKCPKCESDKHAVVDSRSDGTAIRRRRECSNCQQRFSTYERIEYTLPQVVKKDGRREEFSSHKIRAGIVRACEKRPVTQVQIDELVDWLERQVQSLYLKEISSLEIGELMLEGLKQLDQIAYIRFSSVYREFSDVSEFEEVLKSLTSNKKNLRSVGNV
jgi:transcriptional repressor NrdR